MKSSSDCATAGDKPKTALQASTSPALNMPSRRCAFAAALAQKELIGRISTFIPIRIPHLFEERVELRLLARRHLHAHQHSAVVRAVIAIMEQADVPAATHRI